MARAIDRLIELDAQESAREHDRAAFLLLINAVMEALPDGLVVADAEGKIVLFNERAELMFGYHRSEVIGQAVEKLMPERYRGCHVLDRETYGRFDVSKRVHTMGVGMDLAGVRSDGYEFPADITLSRMVVPKGAFTLALVRYSPRADDPAAARQAPAAPEPEMESPNAGQ